MKLPDIHDFSTTALYQQATQILHSSQTCRTTIDLGQRKKKDEG